MDESKVSTSSTTTSSSPPSPLLAIPIAPKTATTLVPIPLVPLALLLLSPHHLPLALQLLCLKLFRALLHTYLRFLKIRGEPGMRPILAALAFWAESA